MIEAADSVLDLIGNTPLVRSHKIASDVASNIYLKLEYLNPGSSVKDRPALQMIRDAESSGDLRAGGTIVEATSGNTGMGLAMAAANRGYKCIFVMPDKMSEEKIRTLRAVGARVVVCPTAVAPEDPRSYYQVAARLADEAPGGFLANQYHNPSNPRAHELTTGPEIWEQTNGEIDAFVSTMGTGGTITGCGRFLKSKNPGIQVVGVDPIGSLYYDYFKTGQLTEAATYLVEGFGEDFLPSTMDFGVVDEVVRVSDQECFDVTRRLVREEGIFAGGSSGGALAGAIKYAQRCVEPKNIVVIMCDSATRYLSKIFDDEWMRENGFLEDPVSGTVAELLGERRGKVITAGHGDPIHRVVEQMRTNAISQLPVTEAGQVVGIINENDVLNHLLAGGDGSDKIDGLIETQMAIVESSNRVSMVGQFFSQNKVVVVLDGGHLSGIITKIDFIDYVSRDLNS
jgi:cystathionine beta-synthase